MPYGKDDARSALPTATAKPVPEEMSGSEYARFYDRDPDREGPGVRIWYARGQNFVLGYGEVEGHAVLDFDEREEHVLLLPDPDGHARVTTPEEVAEASGQSLVILPPGTASVEFEGTLRFVSLVRSTSATAMLAENAASYLTPHANIPPFVAWPDPPGGFRVRVYDTTVPPVPGSAFRIYRCTTFMVNVIDPKRGPRDRAKLSPHHHDDFEQCSLVLEGEYVHHLRWPWGTDANRWREDEHERIGAPSVAVIPPPSVHTSEAVSPGTNHLIDIFSPPREDFSLMPGWVVNADEYPMPDPGAEAVAGA